jgi:processive 1,2-diacylglycerol beta-glucosyltransferase
VVTTDYDTHRLWVCEPAERYFVASAEGAAHLRHYGVAADRITMTGIPIHPTFTRPLGREEARARFGLDPARPVVLQLAGGFGMGPVERIFEAILRLEVPLQIVVVAGRNPRVRRALGRIPVPGRHRVAIMGFSTEIDALLAAADIVVSKPGGLTTAEVLARGAVMAMVNPIPGQESRNSDYLLEHGAAVKIKSLPTLPHTLSTLLANTGRLERVRSKACALARPEAVYEIARLALAEAR